MRLLGLLTIGLFLAPPAFAKTSYKYKYFLKGNCSGSKYTSKDKACKKATKTEVYYCRAKKNGAFKKKDPYKKYKTVQCPGSAGRKVLAGIQPINQTNRLTGKKNLEGCGPVAAAMMMTYWWGKGFPKLIVDSGYNGKKRPTKTVDKLFKTLGAIPFGKTATATLMDTADLGLRRWIKKAGYKDKLKVKRLRAITGHETVKQEVLRQIDAGNPVLMLFNARKVTFEERPHSSGSVSPEQKVNWHYVVVVGYDTRASREDDYKLLVLDGWKDADRAETASWIRGVPFKDLRGAGILTVHRK